MALSGRALRISRNGVSIVGARTDNVTLNNEPLDITDKDDAGWRTMLADAAARSVSCEAQGILKDDALIADATGDAETVLLTECVVTISGLFTLTGDFYLQGLQLGAEQGDAVTFTATLESSGAFVATIGPYNTALPAVTGTLAQGDTLTATTGTWAGDATITYARQWQHGPGADANDPSWANIAAATGATYVLAAGDVGKHVRCKVTATNTTGSTVAYSNIVGPIT